MEKSKKQKAGRIVRVSFVSLWWISVALLAMLLVNIFSAKIRGEVPTVFGYSVMNIVSGSMENKEDPELLKKRRYDSYINYGKRFESLLKECQAKAAL